MLEKDNERQVYIEEKFNVKFLRHKHTENIFNTINIVLREFAELLK